MATARQRGRSPICDGTQWAPLAVTAKGQLRPEADRARPPPSIPAAVEEARLSPADSEEAGGRARWRSGGRGSAVDEDRSLRPSAVSDLGGAAGTWTHDFAYIHGRQTGVDQEADRLQSQEIESRNQEEEGEAGRHAQTPDSGREGVRGLLDGRRRQADRAGWLPRVRDPPGPPEISTISIEPV